MSCWAGEEDINSCSIGIEIINRGHDWGYPDFPLRQIAAVIALCRGIMLRRNVPPHRVLAHSDVAPARKKDPGEKFPWHSLANSGVGHWVQPAPIVRSEALKLGSISDDVAGLQAALARYGYNVPTSGKFDGATMEVVTAFQRHFRPERVDGIADHSTMTTLHALLSSLPADATQRDDGCGEVASLPSPRSCGERVGARGCLQQLERQIRGRSLTPALRDRPLAASGASVNSSISFIRRA